MKRYDVVGICNALVDILVEVQDSDLKALGLNKGVMHLVDAPRQHEVLGRFRDTRQTMELGGSAMNAIRTLAALERKTAFAGMVGEDSYAERITKRMHELGIDNRLGKAKDATGTCVILVTPDGERTMNTCLGASRLYDENLVPHDAIAASRVLHFCGYQWDTDGQKRAIRKAIETAKANDTLVSFDVADPFAVGRNRDDFLALIKHDADIVFSNREEAKMLWDASPEECAKHIADDGAIAVIKLGAEGALVRKGNESHRIAPVATKVLDTTAAGDMFAAGFLFGYTTGRKLPDCGAMAATVASDVISRFGAVVSADVIEKLKRWSM